MIHVHKPEPFMEKAIGVWSKRQDAGDEVLFDGRVDRCECGRAWFIPYRKELNTVEVANLPLPEEFN